MSSEAKAIVTLFPQISALTFNLSADFGEKNCPQNVHEQKNVHGDKQG